jgi:hypothetical protein
MDLPKHLVAVAHQRAPGFTVALYFTSGYSPTSAQRANPKIEIFDAEKITHTYYDSGHFVTVWLRGSKTYLRFEECYGFAALDSEKDSERKPKQEEDKW